MGSVTQQPDRELAKAVLRQLYSEAVFTALFALIEVKADLFHAVHSARRAGRCLPHACAELARLTEAQELIWPSVERAIRKIVAESL
jgi:hypothetical protein